MAGWMLVDFGSGPMRFNSDTGETYTLQNGVWILIPEKVIN